MGRKFWLWAFRKLLRTHDEQRLNYYDRFSSSLFEYYFALCAEFDSLIIMDFFEHIIYGDGQNVNVFQCNNSYTYAVIISQILYTFLQ